jgi:LmbE family N-acetylglucosaminyl deacetylase
VEGEVVSALREACRGFEVCLAPWDADAHADHEAAGRAARRATRRVLSYPVWAWHWAAPADRRLPWPRALRVELPPAVAARKRSAIQAFTSQLTGRAGADGPVLPPAIVAHFTRSQEVLFA